ncbi:hypothetical protein CVE34_13015 [Pseudomonas syringae pv. actinidiae]|nr:hypothetical protein D9N00_09865 [Pseudomonas syringae pv. actinidiae]AYL82409.1 hypothetical protein CN228_23180 [Pseudomonas syringae pv. actinidiae str. Shaanxi_M228]MBL3873652.1 hypothetical protein [Pseudomonas syringae pv. theae]NAS77599.1 hypothetical protein [Pseudomonas syringae pv. actinidiae]NAS91171.1 hypothetical protein [Pseudomonas syringae pv. actinidiae]
MRQWPVLDEFGATVREVGSLSHARHFAGGLDWREECWVSSSSTIVRRSASHAVLDALRPLSQVKQKTGHTFIISTHSVGVYRSDL